MSNFTVALNAVLERMKSEANITRQEYASRIGMPGPTLSSYATGRTKPDAKALEMLTSGLPSADGSRLILAHIIDEIPAAWKSRVTLGDERASRPAIRLADIDWLSPVSLRHVELLLEEARENEHVTGVFAELVGLLGLNDRRSEKKPSLPWPKPEQLRGPSETIPAPGAHTTARLTSTIPTSEETARAAETAPPPRGKGPRARSTKPGVTKTVGKSTTS